MKMIWAPQRSHGIALEDLKAQLLVNKKQTGLIFLTIGLLATLLFLPLTWAVLGMTLKLSFSTPFALCIPIALALLGVNVLLDGWMETKQNRVLEYSIFKARVSSALGPIMWPMRFAVPWTATLFVAMPLMAAMEEVLFRMLPGPTWCGFIISTVVFGLIHIVMGISVRMSLINTFTGGVFFAVYAIAFSQFDANIALGAAIVTHTIYNYSALIWAWQQRIVHNQIVT